jgi:hypothetical protein
MNGLALGLACGFILGSTAEARAAEPQIRRIYKTANHLELGGVADGQVTWSEAVGSVVNGSEVYWFDGRGVRRVTENGYDDWPPFIGGGSLIWRANVNSRGELFRYDGTRVEQLTSNEDYEWEPDASDGQAAWVSGDTLYFFDGQSTRTVASSVVGFPRVDGGQVLFSQAYTSQGSQLGLFDGQTTRTVAISSGLGSLRAGRVAYTADPDGDYSDDVFLLENGVTSRLTQTRVREACPSVHDGIVTWLMQNDRGSAELHAYYAGSTFKLSDYHLGIWAPVVAPEMVVWRELTPARTTRVMAFRKGELFTLAEDPSWVGKVVAHANEVAWNSSDGSVYLATFAAPPPVPASVRLEYEDGSADADNPEWLEPRLRIVNEGEAPLEFADLTIRYFYSNEASDSMTAQVHTFMDEATWGPRGVWPYPAVRTSLGPVSSLDPEANAFVEVAFAPEAGVLDAQGAIQLGFGIHSEGWAELDESNDYSRIPGQVGFAPNERVAVYYRGELVWGTEP